MRVQAEVREVGNELLPLLVLGLGSMALVLGLAFAVQEPRPALSIALAGKVAVATLGASVLLLALIFALRPRPAVVEVEATPEGVSLGSRRIPAGKIRLAYVVRDRDRWSVELERPLGATRILLDDRDQAERLAGAILGREREPAALVRLRRKAHYYLFVGVCTLWVMVYAGLVVVPFVPVAGILMVLAILPFAVWAALAAVPTLVLLSPAGMTFLRPHRVKRIPASEIAGGREVDDDCVRVELLQGGSLRLDELNAHPRDRDASTAAPAAGRLEAALRSLATQRAGATA